MKRKKSKINLKSKQQIPNKQNFSLSNDEMTDLKGGRGGSKPIRRTIRKAIWNAIKDN